MPYGNGLGNGFIYIIIAQVLFFIVTLGLILWFVRNNKQNGSSKQILNERLASGEITRKEYNSLLKTMMNSEEKIKWNKQLEFLSYLH